MSPPWTRVRYQLSVASCWGAVVAFVLSLAICRAAQESSPTLSVPSATEILGYLKKDHPRLLVSTEGFAALKERIERDPTLKSWDTKLARDAEALLPTPPSKYEIPDGLRLLTTSRRVVDRVYLLGLMYRLHGDRRFLDRAWQELEAAADFKDWNPRHFLDTAEMTHAFAIGYDWLYHDWTPAQRERLQTAIVGKGLQPALKLYRAHSGFTTARHNWNQVCNGGIATGALAIGDVDPATAGEVLEGAVHSLPRAMTEFAPDGAWKEGPGYWGYATRYNVVVLAALESALGTDFGLSAIPGFSQTGFFPIYTTAASGHTFNYADGGDSAQIAPHMFWLARRFKQPALAIYQRKLVQPSPLDLVYLGQDPLPAENGTRLAPQKYFRQAEVVTLRSGWDDAEAAFVGFKAGDNKANHSHLDLGTFVYEALGVRWAVDLGADNYNLPGYFGGQRWSYYRLRAEGHNVVVLDPGSGPDQDPTAKANITRFVETPGNSFATTDLTAAYGKSAKSVQRGIALLDGSRLLVQDEIETQAPARFFWFMHTPAEPVLEADARQAILSSRGKRLSARILSPAAAQFMVMKPEPLESSPHPPKQADNAKLRKLAIKLTAVSKERVTVLLTPLAEGEDTVRPLPPVKALSEW